MVYIFFIKKAPATDATLTSSLDTSTIPNASVTTEETSQISKDFISLLLSVKSIKLDDSILKNQAYLSLRDSSITLTQDGNEGRPNPFAPIGSESVIPAISPTSNNDASLIENTAINNAIDANANKVIKKN